MLKDIYFYNALALANELKNGTFTEYRAIKQMIVSIIIGGVGFSVPITVEFQESNIGLVKILSLIFSFIITGIISYYGVWLTYQVNNKGDSKDYFLRFVALSLPVGIQLLVVFLGIAVALVLLGMALITALGASGAYLMQAMFFIAIILFTVMFFTRMRRYFAIASGTSE